MNSNPRSISNTDLCAAIVDTLARIRDKSPRIHCLTNAVAHEFTANSLLAIGAEPSLTSSPDEVANFVETCGALVINLGMLDPERRNSIAIAVDTAEAFQRPWILDPAYAQISPIRLAFAQSLLPRGPDIVRANQMEIGSLSSNAGPEILAREIGGTVAATGEIDQITDGTSTLKIANGDPMMARVTAVGCVTSALTGAVRAVEDDHFLAAAQAIAMADIAGELAVENARGPGSFRVSFIDSLAALDRETIEARVKLV